MHNLCCSAKLYVEIIQESWHLQKEGKSLPSLRCVSVRKLHLVAVEGVLKCPSRCTSPPTHTPVSVPELVTRADNHSHDYSMLNCTNDFKKTKLWWVILTYKQPCEHIHFFLFLSVNKDLWIVISMRIFRIFLSYKFTSRKSPLWKRSQFFSLKNYFCCVHYYRSFLKGNRHFLKMRVGVW